MKLQILSDLHGECGYTINKAEVATTADIVIVAGDISNNAHGYIEYLQNLFPITQVVAIAGNHEHYNSHVTIPENIQKLKNVCEGTNVAFLENNVFYFSGKEEEAGRKFRILGTTLWTDYGVDGNVPISKLQAQNGMMDHKKILSEVDPRHMVHPDELEVLFHKAVQFLDTELSTFFDGTTIVVTHHLPTSRSIHTKYWNSYLNAAFASNLDYMFHSYIIALWVHGHTHDSTNYICGDYSRVICNPMGYPMINPKVTKLVSPGVVFPIENKNFNKKLVIEL